MVSHNVQSTSEMDQGYPVKECPDGPCSHPFASQHQSLGEEWWYGLSWTLRQTRCWSLLWTCGWAPILLNNHTVAAIRGKSKITAWPTVGGPNESGTRVWTPWTVRYRVWKISWIWLPVVFVDSFCKWNCENSWHVTTRTYCQCTFAFSRQSDIIISRTCPVVVVSLCAHAHRHKQEWLHIRNTVAHTQLESTWHYTRECWTFVVMYARAGLHVSKGRERFHVRKTLPLHPKCCTHNIKFLDMFHMACQLNTTSLIHITSEFIKSFDHFINMLSQRRLWYPFASHSHFTFFFWFLQWRVWSFT